MIYGSNSVYTCTQRKGKVRRAGGIINNHNKSAALTLHKPPGVPGIPHLLCDLFMPRRAKESHNSPEAAAQNSHKAFS